MKLVFDEIFATETQLKWAELFDGTDACVTYVLFFQNPIPNSKNSIVADGKQWPRKAAVPQPAPLLSRTPCIKATVKEHSLF